MLKLLAQFFSTLAGTHKHDDITHAEVATLKKALEANKLIVAQQLETIEGLKKVNASQVESIKERTKEKEHYIAELEKAVRQLSEIDVLKDKLRIAQNDKTTLTMTQTLNTQLRKEVVELREEQEKAIVMLKSFGAELRKN